MNTELITFIIILLIIVQAGVIYQGIRIEELKREISKLKQGKK